MVGTLDLRAAAINYQRQPLSQGQAAVPMQTNMNGQIAIDFINRTSDNIKACFFTDLFLALTNNVNMTATEVIQRTQEKMLMLGPVLGRLQNELLDPIIRRTFNILLRRGAFPEVPQSLVDADYDIIYVSPLAKAQRAAQAQDINTFLSIIGQMSQILPEVLDNIDGDEIVQKLSKIYSVDPSVIRESDDVDNLREQRAAAQAAQVKMAGLEQMANIGKTGSEIGRNDAAAESERATRS
jgi:flagellin-specific chaperone FliS